jgi:hypothetical protein
MSANKKKRVVQEPPSYFDPAWIEGLAPSEKLRVLNAMIASEQFAPNQGNLKKDRKKLVKSYNNAGGMKMLNSSVVYKNQKMLDNSAIGS